MQKALELARKDKLIGSSLGAKVSVYCEDDLYEFLNPLKSQLKEIFIVSEVLLIKGTGGNFRGEVEKGLSITVSKASGEKCERCWSFSNTVGKNSTNEKICSRCATILKR